MGNCFRTPLIEEDMPIGELCWEHCDDGELVALDYLRTRLPEDVVLIVRDYALFPHIKWDIEE